MTQSKPRTQPDHEGFVPNGWVDPYPHNDLERPCTGPCCEPPDDGRPVRWTCQGDDCYVSLRKPGECIDCAPPAQAPQKEYSDVDIAWLEQRAREIMAHPRFGEFQAVSPHAAAVFADGGRTRGVSLDAAVTEFETFLKTDLPR